MSTATSEGNLIVTGKPSEIVIRADGALAIITEPPTPPPSPPTIHIPETEDTVAAGIEIMADGTIYIRPTPPPPQTTPPPPTTSYSLESAVNNEVERRGKRKKKRGGKKKIRGPTRGLARLPRWVKH
ncbi:hypothetical protein JYU34_001876 [Plutella xylostella]|uniref:Uncharacterized protein n=1 Tax=Plutella xylostella TaxID=51655 RepID=A0ABQ7R508_PLUXY|nr:hypothetical protein JYU34_001876 [Plutella xylostella]